MGKPFKQSYACERKWCRVRYVRTFERTWDVCHQTGIHYGGLWPFQLNVKHNCMMPMPPTTNFPATQHSSLASLRVVQHTDSSCAIKTNICRCHQQLNQQSHRATDLQSKQAATRVKKYNHQKSLSSNA